MESVPGRHASILEHTMNLKHLPIAFDTRSIRDDGSFEGYASVFGHVDAAREVVAPGAFAATLKSRRRVKMLWQHDPAAPIGRWTKLAEDSRGLHVRGQVLRDIARGNEAFALMKAEAVDGLSIGFRTLDDELDLATGIRTLNAIDLYEISIVTFPANDMATVDLPAARFDAHALEAALSAAGLAPADAAKALTAVRRTLSPPAAGRQESPMAALDAALRRATAILGG